MSNAKHTPTPWGIGRPDGKGICTIDATDPKDDQLFVVCEVFGIDKCDIASAEAHANAAFIVRAANSYDQLVAALRRLIAANDAYAEVFTAGSDEVALMVEYGEAMDAARAALAAAEAA